MELEKNLDKHPAQMNSEELNEMIGEMAQSLAEGLASLAKMSPSVAELIMADCMIHLVAQKATPETCAFLRATADHIETHTHPTDRPDHEICKRSEIIGQSLADALHDYDLKPRS